MKVLRLAALISISVACKNTAPTATAYKEQLGAPAAVTDKEKPTGGSDIESGRTAFTASCAGCHGPGSTAPLNGSEDINAGFGASSAHTSFKSVFESDSANISAYLKSVNTGDAGGGDAAKGTTLITGPCAACHGASASDLDSFSNLETAVGAAFASHTADIKKTISDNKADLAAALKTR